MPFLSLQGRRCRAEGSFFLQAFAADRQNSCALSVAAEPKKALAMANVSADTITTIIIADVTENTYSIKICVIYRE